MNNLKLQPVTQDNIHYLDQVEGLFLKLYEGYNVQGLILKLAEDGQKKWKQSIQRSIGKLSQVYVALKGDEVIGFVSGSVKLTPDFLGERLVGYISGIYIKDDYRRMGIAEKLFKMIEEWFMTKKVHSVELQVVVKNEQGLQFWKKLSFEHELFQLRKIF